jgi:hypothetical protein
MLQPPPPRTDRQRAQARGRSQTTPTTTRVNPRDTKPQFPAPDSPGSDQRHGADARARYLTSKHEFLRTTRPWRLAGLSPPESSRESAAHRLLVIGEHASIHQATQTLGLWPSSLYTQLARLEPACGGRLVHRSRCPGSDGILTPLGEQLRRQARDYLGLTATSPGT